MRKRPEIVAPFTAMALLAHPAFAQPNLPPPPPPPIDQPSEVPSLPPPPLREQTPASQAQPPPASPPRRPAAPPPPAPYRASARPPRTEEVVYVEPPETHPVAVTLNPIGLLRGRLSANLEIEVEPHHSLVVSPNVLVFHANRGDPGSLLSEGLGFASPTSSSVGLEFGYHYWWRWSGTLRGPFLGPALLLGSTTDATVGDPTHAQSYWGIAFDVGWQEVMPGGFTAGVGAGLEVVRMAGTGGVVPRFLLQVGWSF
jgi:hypothetical protein